MREHRLRSALLFIFVYVVSTGAVAFVAITTFEVGDSLVGWPWLWLIFASLCLPIAIVGVFATWAAPARTVSFWRAFAVNSFICAVSPLLPIAIGGTGLGIGSAYALALALLFASASFFSGVRRRSEES